MKDALAPVGDGHTEVPAEAREQLIPTYIATLGELHEAEADNIANGTFGLRPTLDRLLDDTFLRELRRLMFNNVWRWAGKYRKHDVNIGGVDWQQVSTLVRALVDDTRGWVAHESYVPDEIAVRFHHRLVQIHPFVNGNGRHGRFATDYLLEAVGLPRFTWGAGLALDGSRLRTRYREALQRMDHDREDLGYLLAFARS